MAAFIQDLRFGLRTLMLRPSFTVVATAVLALGIGASTAIFSVVDAVVLRPLPFPQPDRLAVVWEANEAEGLPFMNVAPPNLDDLRVRNHSFEAIGAWTNQSFTFALRGTTQHLYGAAVTHDMFRVLGVAPELGRTFTAEEHAGAGAAVALISHGLWQRAFGGKRDVVGSVVTVNGAPREIAGVMPEGFNFAPPVAFEGVPAPRTNDLWVPLAADNLNPQRGAHYLLVLGRLRSGVANESAERELRGIAEQMAAEHPDTNAGWSIKVVPFARQITGDERPAVAALGIAVAMVLLLACANVAALVIARGVSRARELEVRMALGATRGRLARQLLTESLALAAIGGVAGSLIASWMARVVRLMAGPLMPRLDEVVVDARSLIFAVVACVVAALLFGTIPALQASRAGAASHLRHRTAAPQGLRMQSALVVIELALSLVLLSAAALLGTAFLRLMNTDAGFRPEQTLTAHVTLPRTRYATRAQRTEFLDRVLTRLRGLPGIAAAGAIDAAPLADDRQGTSFTIDGETPTPAIEAATVNFAFVTPGYFPTLGVAIVRGRDFADTDREASEPVIVVNQAFARQFFGDADPIGRRIRAGFNTQTPRTIIGVVGDERHVALDKPAPPGMYTTFAQVGWANQLTLAVRTTGSAAAATAALRESVAAVDVEVPLFDVRTMQQIVSDSVSRPRFAVMVIGMFAATALLLSAVGVYGVMSQAVSRRMPEFGVRLALGAAPRDLRRLVLTFGFRLAAIGVGIGVPAALIFGRVLSHLFSGVDPADLASYLTVTLTLALSVVVAAVLPARRASRVDPIVALRAD